MFYACSDTELKNVKCKLMLQYVPYLTIQFICNWFFKLPSCTGPGIFLLTLPQQPVRDDTAAAFLSQRLR